MTWPKSRRQKWLASLTPQEKVELTYRWDFWGRENQHEPPGNWRFWLVDAGRGFGKTRTGAEWVRAYIESKRAGRVALVAETAADARDVMVEGESGILAISPPWMRPEYQPSKRRLIWPNGAIATTYSAEDPEQLRGPQHDLAWCLAGDTSVLMGDGTTTPLRDLKPGDFVMTRNGAKKILGHALTKRNAVVYSVLTMGGQGIIGTAEHPVWVEGQGFIPLGDLKPGMRVCVGSVSSGAAKFGTDTAIGTTKSLLDFIEPFGKLNTGRFQTDTTFTISTATKATTESTILNYCHTENIAPGTWKKRSGRTEQGHWSTQWRPCDDSEQHGCRCQDNARCVVASTEHLALRLLPIAPNDVWTPRVVEHLPAKTGCALGAGSLTKQIAGCKCIAASDAIRERSQIEGQSEQREQFLAPTVPRCLKAQEVTRSFVREPALWLSTQAIVSVERLVKRLDVYDIAVDEEREFFANGILVHNCDEIAKWRYGLETWSNLDFGLRLGLSPRGIATTTPRPVKLVRMLLKDPLTIVTHGSMFDNAANLPAATMDSLRRTYEGTRLGRQELMGELLEDVEGALWQRAWFDNHRATSFVRSDNGPAVVRDGQQILLKRIYVVVDPAITHGDDSDQTGIAVVAQGEDNDYYVLEAIGVRLTPEGWPKRVLDLFDRFGAVDILAESNQGGEMVRSVIKKVRSDAPVRLIRALKSKTLRAEPVALLYEQGRVHHVGTLADAEDQMCSFPVAAELDDILDAIVHGINELHSRAGGLMVSFV